MKSNLLFIAASLLVCSSLSAQSYTEGADLPGTGTGPAFTVSGPSITIAGQLNTPADGQDRFQITVPAGCQITSVSYSMTDNFNIGVNGFFQFGTSNQQVFPPLTGTFSNGPTGAFPVGQGTYDCMIAANIAANDSWSMVFNTSCTTGLAEVSNVDQIHIYPNPATDYLSVHITLDPKQNGIFEMDNILGQSVGQYKLVGGENVFTVSTSTFASGVYCCKTLINGIPDKLEKLIIEH